MRNQPLLSASGSVLALCCFEISIIFCWRAGLCGISLSGPWSLPVRSGALGGSRNLARARKPSRPPRVAVGSLSASRTDLRPLSRRMRHIRRVYLKPSHEDVVQHRPPVALADEARRARVVAVLQ